MKKKRTAMVAVLVLTLIATVAIALYNAKPEKTPERPLANTFTTLGEGSPENDPVPLKVIPFELLGRESDNFELLSGEENSQTALPLKIVLLEENSQTALIQIQATPPGEENPENNIILSPTYTGTEYCGSSSASSAMRICFEGKEENKVVAVGYGFIKSGGRVEWKEVKLRRVKVKLIREDTGETVAQDWLGIPNENIIMLADDGTWIKLRAILEFYQEEDP
jgi:hypothetical protein